jgi:phage baseplate assembly protein W
MATTRARSSTYRGFSTQAHIDNRGKTFSTIDIETVKRDLLNHIYTIPGERVMQPDFGTRIPLMAFEPLDTISIQIIKDDLTKVFNYDPRVRLIDIAVLPMPDNNAIVALVDLQYIELDVNETMKLSFPVGA